MKSISDVALVIQARLNSERVPEKMIRPFSNSSLFEIAIRKILKSTVLTKDNIYVSVYEESLKKIAQSYDLNIFERSEESANNDDSLQKIYEWHDKLPFKYVVKLNACSPLLKTETIDDFLTTFLNQKEENLFGVIEYKDYFWNSKGSLTTPWPSSQTLMNTKAVEPTYKGAHVLYASRMDFIAENKFMGDFKKEGGIKLFPMNELECFDIDYEWQFEVGELLYNNLYS